MGSANLGSPYLRRTIGHARLCRVPFSGFGIKRIGTAHTPIRQIPCSFRRVVVAPAPASSFHFCVVASAAAVAYTAGQARFNNLYNEYVYW